MKSPVQSCLLTRVQISRFYFVSNVDKNSHNSNFCSKQGLQNSLRLNSVNITIARVGVSFNIDTNVSERVL